MLFIFLVLAIILAMVSGAMNGGMLINGQEFRFGNSDATKESYPPRTYRSIDYDRQKQSGYHGNEF